MIGWCSRAAFSCSSCGVIPRQRQASRVDLSSDYKFSQRINGLRLVARAQIALYKYEYSNCTVRRVLLLSSPPSGHLADS